MSGQAGTTDRENRAEHYSARADDPASCPQTTARDRWSSTCNLATTLPSAWTAADVVHVLRGKSRLALKRIVSTCGTNERPDERELVRIGGQQRQQLANLKAGQLRRDAGELAANLNRSLRLQIDHVLLRRPTVEMDDDHALLRLPNPRSSFGPKQSRQRQRRGARPPNASGFPRGQSPAGKRRRNTARCANSSRRQSSA